MAIPLAIFMGVYVFENKKYYFTSLLVLLECILPFAMLFEKRNPKARELVLIGVLCAIAVAGRMAFAALPQCKPAVALVIVSGICLGGEVGFIVGAVTGLLSNFFFGQGPWTPWQMFAFGIIGFLAGVLFHQRILPASKPVLCLFGISSVLLIYGIIMNTYTVLLLQPHPTVKMLLAAWAAGLPFDCIHALSTAFFLWFTAHPMMEKIERIKTKHGLLL